MFFRTLRKLASVEESGDRQCDSSEDCEEREYFDRATRCVVRGWKLSSNGQIRGHESNCMHGHLCPFTRCCSPAINSRPQPQLWVGCSERDIDTCHLRATLL